jgi:hypothetical protein
MWSITSNGGLQEDSAEPASTQNLLVHGFTLEESRRIEWTEDDFEAVQHTFDDAKAISEYLVGSIAKHVAQFRYDKTPTLPTD